MSLGGFLCPLSGHSRFLLSGPATIDINYSSQRNCNATDVEAMSCRESAGGASVVGDCPLSSPICVPLDEPTAKGGGLCKRVDFASCESVISRSRTKLPSTATSGGVVSLRSSGSGSGGSSSSLSCGLSAGQMYSRQQTCLPPAKPPPPPPTRTTTESMLLQACPTGMLVPLSSNQSNLRPLSTSVSPSTMSPPTEAPLTMSATTRQRSASNDRWHRNDNNEHQAGKTAEPDTTDGAKANDKSTACNTEAGRGGGGGDAKDLLRSCGVPYWNVYEFEDFRDLENGQSHVFDPQKDANLHREGIILDNYNRLKQSFPRFRMPLPVYHVR